MLAVAGAILVGARSPEWEPPTQGAQQFPIWTDQIKGVAASKPVIPARAQLEWFVLPIERDDADLG
jgi:hypothetical protein